MIVFVSLFAIWLIFYFIPVGLWFSALVSGVRISLLQLILMRWRKVPPSTIVSSMIESTKAGLELNPNELEAHYLAGGNVTSVVHALVSAQKANIMLDFKTVPLFSYIRCRIELYHCNIPEPEARSPGCGLKSRLP